jgi:hypothetical protein
MLTLENAAGRTLSRPYPIDALGRADPENDRVPVPVGKVFDPSDRPSVHPNRLDWKFIALREPLISCQKPPLSHVAHLPEASDVVLARQQRHAYGRNRCR